MRIIKSLLLLLVLPFVGCQNVSPDRTVAVQIVNSSSKDVDYMAFSTNQGQGNLQKPGLKQQKTVAVDFSFANVDKTDGSYRLRYKFAATTDTVTRTFGYYTNGYPIDSQINIVVYNDSISVKTVLKKSGY